MRFLFIMETLGWPRMSGPDVHGSQMMRALASKGHQVALATQTECSTDATKDIGLSEIFTYQNAEDTDSEVRATWLQRKYKDYWGVTDRSLHAIRKIGDQFNPDVVVTIGLGGLPYHLAFHGVLKVWYAADEWFIHHLSLMKINDVHSWSNLRPALFRLGYERAYSKPSRIKPLLSIWLVSSGST
jgi:polysaccharide biosynthesis protein PslH